MADLNDAAQFALCVALGISYILKPLLDFVDGATKPLSPVLEFAVAVLIATLPLAYLMGSLASLAPWCRLFLLCSPWHSSPSGSSPAARRRDREEVLRPDGFVVLVAVLS
ncbi:hypothetical protein SORBI_3010G075200 [Sorghum bicolor]|uniref:Uncharacterized protein n=1 Tax=Sorghum bicolor TaxID=4558 RepID=A0A194YHW6_SORBI|nr:hypothetical protein SORBI_3010G075200 [Sorghum bicolor]